MQVWQYILLIFIIAIAFPIGQYLAKTCKEELRAGKKAFFLLMIFSLLTAVVILFTKLDFENKLFITTSMLFIFVIASISFCEGKEKSKKR